MTVMLSRVASDPRPVSVHVEADIRLAHAGLTRAALRAGLKVVPADQPASFTLKATTLAPSQPGLDVFVGGEHIHIVVHGMPTRAQWSAILPLVQQLATDTGDETSAAND